MGKMQLKFEITTPMFMHGARPGDEAELRASSIKGLMRYWWRAVNVHRDVKTLLEKEHKFFGGTSNDALKSPFVIRVDSHIYSSKKYPMLPHKDEKRAYNTAIFPTTIKITLVSSYNLESAAHLLVLASLLGGFGQRARRGFGSIQLRNAEFENVNNFIDRVVEELKYWKMGNINVDSTLKKIMYIPHNKPSSENEYPYLLSVVIGKRFNTWEDAVKEIGQASHDFDSRILGYVDSIRISGKKKTIRFASPVWATVKKIGKQFYIVFTEVNTITPPEIKINFEKEKYLKDSFISALTV